MDKSIIYPNLHNIIDNCEALTFSCKVGAAFRSQNPLAIKSASSCLVLGDIDELDEECSAAVYATRTEIKSALKKQAREEEQHVHGFEEPDSHEEVEVSSQESSAESVEEVSSQEGSVEEASAEEEHESHEEEDSMEKPTGAKGIHKLRATIKDIVKKAEAGRA